MPYIDRDLQGHIVGIYNLPQYEQQEFVDGDLETPFNQVAAFQRLRDVRALILNALTGIGLDAVATGDTATLNGVVTARQGLKDAPKDPVILAATSDDAFDAAAKALYTRLVIAAPATVRSAFKDVQ